MPKELDGYKTKSKASPVNISMRFRELIAAKVMGYMPHQWDLFPMESKAEMMAVLEIDNKIAGFQQDSLTED